MTKLCPVILLPKYSGNSVDINEVFKRLQRYATQMAVISNGKYSELVVVISSSRLQDLQMIFPRKPFCLYVQGFLVILEN